MHQFSANNNDTKNSLYARNIFFLFKVPNSNTYKNDKVKIKAISILNV